MLITERWNQSDTILLSRYSHCRGKRWWKGLRFCPSFLYLLMIDDSQHPTQKYHPFDSRIGVFSCVCHDAFHCGVSDDYFGGRLEALSSPFPYWWWRTCLLWPPVWWCTLHLRNVSVRRRRPEKRSVICTCCNCFVSFSCLEWNMITRDKKKHSAEEVTLNWVQWDKSRLDVFLLLKIARCQALQSVLLPSTHCLLGYALWPWIWMSR